MTALAHPITGGCQCGAARYSISMAPIMAYACHCTNCQRITASAFGVSIIVPEGAMTVDDDAALARYEWQADSGNHRFGDFCKSCGSRIRHGDAPSRGFYVVRGGTLDDKRWVRPAAHTWTKSAMAWMKFGPDDLLYDAQPDDYGPVIARYRDLTKDLTGD